MKATFDGVVLAESDKVVQVDGNNYYPLASLNMEHFSPIEKTTTCGWKGEANYFDVKGPNGAIKPGGAWIYKTPKAAASQIANHVAFYPFVKHA